MICDNFHKYGGSIFSAYGKTNVLIIYKSKIDTLLAIVFRYYYISFIRGPTAPNKGLCDFFPVTEYETTISTSTGSIPLNTLYAVVVLN